MGVTRVCSQPGCPNLRPCPNHAPKPWSTPSARNQARSSGNGWDQQRTRKRILKRDGHRCYIADCTTPATIVDHVIPMAEGGTDTDDNKASMCEPHHDEKSRGERRRGRSR